jgi:hypothetical protein
MRMRRVGAQSEKQESEPERLEHFLELKHRFCTMTSCTLQQLLTLVAIVHMPN